MSYGRMKLTETQWQDVWSHYAAGHLVCMHGGQGKISCECGSEWISQ